MELLRFEILAASGALLLKASTEVHILGDPVDLWVVVGEPFMSQYHLLITQVCDCKECSFGFQMNRVASTTSVIAPAWFSVPSTLYTFIGVGSLKVGRLCCWTNSASRNCHPAPESMSAEASVYPSVPEIPSLVGIASELESDFAMSLDLAWRLQI
jgi:hypothetical protein